LFIVLGIIAGVSVVIKLAKQNGIKEESIIDSVFYAVIFGIIGARVYHVFLELPYYLQNPLDVFKVWQGGLAIHGGIIAGFAALYFYSKKKKINFFSLLSLYAPGLALAQAIGRWGNFFNQELYGLPTNLPWGIPIEPLNRVSGFYNYNFFHPAFLYESLGNLAIFFFLIYIHRQLQKKNVENNFYKILPFIVYLCAYSILRFSLEFVRIDQTLVISGLRFPQIVSLCIIVACAVFVYKKFPKKQGLD
jgi:phosphatidylglycerol---prolipoprotein diacylglyceryl transferase